MTVNELVRILDLSSGSPTAWKRGTIPRNATLVKIADYFNVSTDYLLGKSSGASDSDNIQLAQVVLSSHLSIEPNIPSGQRVRILFEVSEFDPAIVCYNLGIDQCVFSSWIESNDLPPRPIIDKFLGVFHLQVSQLLSEKELRIYREESREWGSSSVDLLDEVDVAFYGEYKELGDDDKETIRSMVRVMRERRAKQQEK